MTTESESAAGEERPRIVRAKGFLREEDGQHDRLCGARRSTAEHFGAPRNLPSQALAMGGFAVFHDQLDTETCVGHGITCGAHVRLAVQGIKAPYGSPRATFTLSNMLLRAKPDDPIGTNGTWARTAMQAGADFGIVPENQWPLVGKDGKTQDPGEELPPDVLQRASGWKVKEQFFVAATDQSRIDACCAALAQNYPLPCAGDVDEVFEVYDGKGVLPAPDPKKVVGGHMTCILGYRTNAAGKREFLCANSWSGWGMPGSLFWASEAWVIALYEVYAFTLTHGPVAVGQKEGDA